jgi:hypothetical protein
MECSKLMKAALIVSACVAAAAIGLRAAPAGGQVAVRDQGYVPFSEEPIRYLSDDLDDPLTRLQARINRGELRLEYEPSHGYLKSVLAALQVPISSQTLVFSKTSFQYRRISPQTPRALYFNDDVYIGWVNGGKSLEVIAFDPRQGAIFYILDQRQPVERPVFERAELDCTQCHVAAGTRNVPGVLIRSIHARPTGTQAPRTPSFITGHESPLSERFGGWYVTGTHGGTTHMGNAISQDPSQPERLDRAAGANLRDLASRFDSSAYLTGHSDIVAQLVQAHQTQMHNLITQTNYQTRIALHAERAGQASAEETRRKIEAPAEALVRYLLFADEAPLEAPVEGTSGFTQEFGARGPRDARGRSLRALDLRTRLFTYPCSYLIYSESFDALPEPAKGYVYQRLLDVLTGRDTSDAFARLSAADRRAILEILVETKSGLPAEWRQAAAARGTASSR